MHMIFKELEGVESASVGEGRDGSWWCIRRARRIFRLLRLCSRGPEEMTGATGAAGIAAGRTVANGQ